MDRFDSKVLELPVPLGVAIAFNKSACGEVSQQVRNCAIPVRFMHGSGAGPLLALADVIQIVAAAFSGFVSAT